MKKLLRNCVLTAALSLSFTYASESLVYTPNPTKHNLLKTAIVGLGLMMMPKPTEAYNVNGFGDCYIGTIDPQNTVDMTNIHMNTIKPIPCNYYGNENNYVNIDMTISGICQLDQPAVQSRPNIAGFAASPLTHCSIININKINLCGKYFQTNYNAELEYNYKNNGNYNQFSLYVYHSLQDDPGNTNFENTFKNFINNNRC